MKNISALPIVGRSTLITLGGVTGVPAKVDTGADSSSAWASAVQEIDGKLHVTLFGQGSTLFPTTKLVADEYETVRITSSNGGREKRYAIYLPVEVNGQLFDRVRFTLADRATLVYPVLLGRHFLSGSFLVDTSKELPTAIHDQLRVDRDGRLGKSALH